MSNNLPQTDTTGGSDDNIETGTAGQSYLLDNSNTVALGFHKSAVGRASLMGLRTSATWFEQYQGWLLLAKQAVGQGVLRPGAAVELSKSATGSELTNATALSSF